MVVLGMAVVEKRSQKHHTIPSPNSEFRHDLFVYCLDTGNVHTWIYSILPYWMVLMGEVDVSGVGSFCVRHFGVFCSSQANPPYTDCGEKVIVETHSDRPTGAFFYILINITTQIKPSSGDIVTPGGLFLVRTL